MAAILDEFSALAFGYEWDQRLLSKQSWRKELSGERIDLLFVESAWSGNRGEWQYQLTGPSGPKDDVRQLVAWCKSEGIPTVFWNKEDPPHYEEFLEAARLFDFVFTTDEDRIPDYRRDLGHERIGTLKFAAQPKLHNPVRTPASGSRRDIAFAGMYFKHKFAERRAQMEILLGAALDISPRLKFGLDIFSRQFGSDGRYQFPQPFATHVRGQLSYLQMLRAYKAYKIFLNVNSVVDSPTMCPRRVFEILAAGTSVVSTPSRALQTIFTEDEVPLVRDRTQAGQVLRSLIRSPELRDQAVHKAQRKVWAEHTYSHRVESVLSTALPELSRPIRRPLVSICVSSNRPKQLRSIFETASRQVGVETELVLLTHGYEPRPGEVAGLVEEFDLPQVTQIHAEENASLGECLNRCFEAASGEIAAKMDDDDYYGPHYLQDQTASLRFSEATVVGKQCHYMYVESRNATILRFEDREHAYTGSVMGPTLVARRDTFLEYPFKAVGRGEDTDFLRRVSNDGGSIYSSDRFNYWQLRSGGAHTWTATDDELLASGTVRFFGDPTDHVVV